MNEKISKVLDRTPEWLKKFFYSDAYLIFLAALVFVSWITKQPVIGIVIGSVTASVSLAILDDITPFLPIVLFAAALIPTAEIEPYIPMLAGAVPMVLALLFHICYYPPKKVKTRMLYPQLAITLAMFLGGCNVISAERYTGSLVFLFMLGFLVLAVYLLFSYYGGRNNYVKLSVFAAKTLTWYGLLIAAEVVAYYVIHKPPFHTWGMGSVVDVGWSIDNNLATILLLASPMAFYLAVTQKRKWYYTILAIINFGATVLTFSRGGILFGTIMAFVSAAAAVFKARGRSAKLQIAIPCVIVITGLAIFYFMNMEELNDFIVKLARVEDKGVSNRDKLYMEALQQFAANPLFGCGLGYDGRFYNPKDVMPFYWFHSTLFQIIGSTGLVGIAAFLYYYIVRYRIVLMRAAKNNFSLFILLGLFGFEAYSMIDTGTFIGYPVMVIAMLMTMYAERSNEEPDTPSLPDNGMLCKYVRGQI